MATLNTTANLTQITAPRVPLIDERTGLVSREWYRFFLSLYDLTGGGQNNTTLTDLQLGPPPAQQEDLTGLVVNIESLQTQPNQESALEQISELEKQIQGLATAIGCSCNEVAAELQKQIDALNVTPLPNVSASLTSGTSILYGDGSGGFSNVVIGSGITFSGGTLSATGTGGTVTSVSGTVPVVSSGGTTPAISLAANYGDTQSPYSSKTANFVLAAPNGISGNPTFRAIVAADIPTLNQNTTGNAATVTTNANLTGAVTSVGNATSLGSFTSAQLATAITDKTGTGAAVFATSPVLVTPALGTPSSGVVTNLTGTASININGTVGATTPSTVAATTLAANNLALNNNNVPPTAGIYQGLGIVQIRSGTGGVTINNSANSIVNASFPNAGGLAVTGTVTSTTDATLSGVRVGKGAGAIVSNTAVGSAALNANTTGANNTGSGSSALRDNNTGNLNTANGASALLKNTVGNDNTAYGRSSLQNNISGSNNAAGGSLALLNNTTGSGNTALNPLNSAGSYVPVFDPTTENNRFCMGSTGVTNAYIQVAWTVVSDARDKTNFAPVPHGLEFVKALQPTAYQFRTARDSEETNGGVRYGFKAQDVLALEGANPVIVDNEDADKLRMIDTALIPVLVKALQELNAKFDTYVLAHP